MNSPSKRACSVLVLLVGTAACRTPASRAPAAAAPAVGGRVEASIPRSGTDPSPRFFGAYQRAEAGDASGALELLLALDREGWAIPLDPRDWPGLAGDPAFTALSARVAARAPATPHAAPAFTIAERGLVPEGIAHDPATGALLVGSIRQRKILRIAPDGGVSELVPSAGGGLLAPLGLEVDAARGLLWAGSMASRGMVGFRPGDEGRAGLFAFDLATGAPRRAVLAPPGEHLLNDLAIGEDGTVFVTDSTAGAVWRLAPGAEALEPVVAAGFVYPNGLVLARDRLLVADALGLTIVPLDGGSPRPLEGPAGVPLGGIDGLSWHGSALVAIQNGLGTARVVRLRLDDAAERVEGVEVLEAGNPGWHLPTTGAVAGDALLYLGNSHVDGISAAGLVPEAAAAPAIVFRLELAR